jgi:hypothetical protein
VGKNLCIVCLKHEVHAIATEISCLTLVITSEKDIVSHLIEAFEVTLLTALIVLNKSYIATSVVHKGSQQLNHS